MEDASNPTQGNTESQSVELGNVGQSMTEAEANTGIDNLVADMFGLNESPTQEAVEEPEVSEEATQSEEPTEQEEQVEDVDIDTPDEVLEESDVEESGVQEKNVEVVAFPDFKDMGLEFDGEVFTGSQLKSMLGQLKKTGEDARKADQAVKEIEAQKAQLKEQEAWLSQRTAAASQSDQLTAMQADARKINAAIDKARAEGDMYEVAVQKDHLDVLKGKYAKVQQEVQHVQHQAEAKQVAAAEQGLKDKGLGYLLEDNPQAKAWTSYASSKLSDSELRAITLIPSLAEMVEKARKYDNSVKTKGVKLKSSGKTLKPGVNQPKKINTTNKKDYSKNPDSYFLDLAKDVLNN